MLLAPLAMATAALAAGSSDTGHNPGISEKAVSYDLKALNGSKQNGSVELTPMGGKTQVTITLSNQGPGAEPAHVHTGSCPTPGAVVYPLTNVFHGSSTTVLNVPIAQLNKTGFSVNVHKSAAQISHYVSCGNITP